MRRPHVYWTFFGVSGPKITAPWFLLDLVVSCWSWIVLPRLHTMIILDWLVRVGAYSTCLVLVVWIGTIIVTGIWGPLWLNPLCSDFSTSELLVLLHWLGDHRDWQVVYSFLVTWYTFECVCCIDCPLYSILVWIPCWQDISEHLQTLPAGIRRFGLSMLALKWHLIDIFRWQNGISCHGTTALAYYQSDMCK